VIQQILINYNKTKGAPLLNKIVEELKVNGADIGAPFEAEEI